MGGGNSAPIASNTQSQNAQNTLQNYAGAGTNSNVQNLLSQYGSGNQSLSQTLQAIQGLQNPTSGTGSTPNPFAGTAFGNTLNNSGLLAPTSNNSSNGALVQGAEDQLATNPLTAGLLASSQVMSNPLNQGLYGQSGLQGQAENNYTNATGNLSQDRQALSGNDPSYGLQQSDLAAYGQGADQIGRQSAAQGQGIAQSLAARGLGSGANGSAIASYAGNYGNQNEQLGQLQNQISQNRINTAQGLAQARNASDLQQQSGAAGLATSMGQLGQQAYGQQLGSNMAGAQNNYNEAAGAAGSALNNQTAQQNVNNEQFAQQQQPGVLGSIAGAVGGGLAGGLTGGLGSTLGKAAGSALTGGSASPSPLSSSI